MKFLFALIMLSFASTCAAADKSAEPGHPQLAVSTLAGQPWRLSDQRGKWVVINFWATWCSPCIKEMPEISGFVSQHEQVEAIGLAYEDSDKATVEAFLKKHPVAYPIALVDPFKPPADFDTPRGLPTTYIIAPDGSVSTKHVGPITAVDLAKLIGVKPG
ncbi:MAG: TlpA disulfide reductase family protein [Rhodanobacteraceae bacterium]